jgi:hypothetical protein
MTTRRVLRDLESPTCKAILVARFGEPVRTSQFDACLRRCDACGIAFSNSNDSPARIDRVPEQALARLYTLMALDHSLYRSTQPGTLGGYWRGRIYGQLECTSAVRASAGQEYAPQRVFFADEAAAQAAGFRPCGHCMPAEYKVWKAQDPTRS